MVGPVINSVGIVAGAALGSIGGQMLSAEFRQKINYVFGCIAMGIGVFMIAKGHSLPPVIIALLFGALIGEACRIESLVMRLALRAVDLLRREKGTGPDISGQAFRDQFAVVTVLFCVSSLGVMGPMHEGITRDPSLLLIKALLDFFTAIVFAANIGGVIGALALPQFALQSFIFCMATTVVPLISPTMFADFSACGGIIMLGTGLRQLGLVQAPILGMLPALFLVMPISHAWSAYLAP
jgi:uncharacterized membrane protein YqgA involved in biofilm formation